MKRQISFLGKANVAPSTGYRVARYRFDEGDMVESAFFGPALAQITKPDDLWILGTSGSMWDVLLEAQGGAGADDDRRLALWEKANGNAVTDADLAGFEELVSRHLGLPCHLRTIAFARNEAEQANLLATLATVLSPGDEVVLDVTHGFRHLPMLMLAGAHYLERVRRVKVVDIVYGALDMTDSDGVTPVVRLTGLLRVLDWVQALAAYDASGNYGGFGELLEQAGVSGAKSALQSASAFERMTNCSKAREKLTTLDLQGARANPLAGLFLPQLEERLSWWRRPERWRWEASLAHAYFERGDYLRAAIFAQEAVISRDTEERDLHDYDSRETTRKTLQKNHRSARKLFDLRNSLAHGMNPGQRMQKATRNPESLRKELAELMDELRIK